MMAGRHVVIPVEVTDAQGYETGRSVPVLLDYIIETDQSYGEDADGNRGTVLVSYDILDAYLEPDALKDLTADEAERALQTARAYFEHNPTKWS